MKDTYNKFKYAVLGAFVHVLKLKMVFTKALFIPFFLYLLLNISEYMEPIPLVSFAIGIISIIVHTIFAVTTHRIVLLGPESVSKWDVFNWSRRETRFALHMIILGLIFIPLLVLGLIPYVGTYLILLVFFWLFGRLSLVFPAIAIDQKFTYMHSWELTKKNQLLMVLVVIFFPLLLLIPSILLNMLPYTFIISSILDTLSTVFMVAALSIVYREVCTEFYES